MKIRFLLTLLLLLCCVANGYDITFHKNYPKPYRPTESEEQYMQQDLLLVYEYQPKEHIQENIESEEHDTENTREKGDISESGTGKVDLSNENNLNEHVHTKREVGKIDTILDEDLFRVYEYQQNYHKREKRMDVDDTIEEGSGDSDISQSDTEKKEGHTTMKSEIQKNDTTSPPLQSSQEESQLSSQSKKSADGISPEVEGKTGETIPKVDETPTSLQKDGEPRETTTKNSDKSADVEGKTEETIPKIVETPSTQKVDQTGETTSKVNSTAGVEGKTEGTIPKIEETPSTQKVDQTGETTSKENSTASVEGKTERTIPKIDETPSTQKVDKTGETIKLFGADGNNTEQETLLNTEAISEFNINPSSRKSGSFDSVATAKNDPEDTLIIAGLIIIMSVLLLSCLLWTVKRKRRGGVVHELPTEIGTEMHEVVTLLDENGKCKTNIVKHPFKEYANIPMIDDDDAGSSEVDKHLDNTTSDVSLEGNSEPEPPIILIHAKLVNMPDSIPKSVIMNKNNE